jgi:esterase/lipase superfamily enzyme
MQRIYHTWHSPILGRDMELLEFGHQGCPILVFPTSMGRFYQYEDNGMIEAVRAKYEDGFLHAFCVDSVDSESWYNHAVPPADRVRRHVEYEKYLLTEVIPFIRARNDDPRLVVTGCSFGGFHSVNFALRHPDVVTHCIAMSGAYDLRSFLGGYYDQDFYFNQPLDFLPNLNDGWYWDRYQKMAMVLAVGEHDICLGDNLRLAEIMRAKSIPHYLDVWNSGAHHDWPWWRQMAVKFF